MAHASVASLLRTIELLSTSNSPMQSLICDHREDFSAFHEKISSMEVFLKNFEKNNISGELTDLEVQIKEVGNIVEQTIQLRVTEVVLENDENLREKAQDGLSDSLRQVAEDIDHIWKESTKIQDKGKHASKESTVQEFPISSKDILNAENNMVGRDDQRKQLVEDLTRSYSGEPKVIPIVGMGGIGKTTLANEVYNDVCIHSHFDVCAWATVSQQHNVKKILLSLLRSTNGEIFGMNNEVELANILQKSLKGKRYLIVLDDMWNSEAWDDVRLCFPSENKESGILLTTRNNELACYAGILPASIPSAKAFPATLKKLKLERTFLSWLYLDIIAEMPNLEKDTNDNFPVLERLMIRSCHHLKEIPIEFADINTLQLIQLKWCLPELGKSAARIQKEQEDLRNNPVDVRISDPFTDDDDDGVVPYDDDNHSEDSDANAAEDDDN
ncbi:hypothetical protein CQW23_06465 [Capsicum baccatum]|uniref:NB-ARC domain-containing protein n=1 Tax=Capsicum baccatum TaxID=33114 RepID=A0A2G2X3G6_CAPBA|nr:hypothetical protein CQW23_06465 [Capsicum baccatum]